MYLVSIFNSFSYEGDGGLLDVNFIEWS